MWLFNPPNLTPKKYLKKIRELELENMRLKIKNLDLEIQEKDKIIERLIKELEKSRRLKMTNKDRDQARKEKRQRIERELQESHDNFFTQAKTVEEKLEELEERVKALEVKSNV